MLAAQGNILVRVNLSQKDETTIGGNTLKSAKRYNENFRERNPVIAEVIDGLGEIKTGSWVVCNYNYFDEESPLQLTDDTYSIPVDEEIFAIVKEDGSLKPICGNVLVERIYKPTPLEITNDLKQPYLNQGIVAANSGKYFKGQHIFWLAMADYEIIYNWGGKDMSAIKVHQNEIVGYIKKY